MKREDLPDLMAFLIIVQEGSFRKAAAKLHVSPSGLSHAMRRLEARLGFPLLLRTTRSMTPTSAGSDLAASLEIAFGEIDRELRELADRKGQVAGTVRINVHRTAADLFVLPKLSTLQERHPGVKVELVIDDGLTDIIAAGCHAGIRNGKLLANDMVAVRISGEHRTAVVGSPAYLSRHPTPNTPEDLRDHRCIGYRFVTSRSLHRWRFLRGDQDLLTDFEPALIVDDIQVVVRAALQGLGLAYTLREAVAEHVENQTLVEVLKDWSTPVAADYLYYPSRGTVSPELRAVIEHLRI
ncbi:transcriptional regulator, LysR family [Dickeya chrysanthemi Ech1591]|uniref:Transcriptional regulator, LysR family n=1 Tax=Dickeya chrysanthemi (strain Ech1591) TaxID=561229 RepID=C6CFT6_DICC1|nr:LysR family transcriptional regulator [Dickeya chrysanthemi]ACT04919.1 transcriptional regulator, LysR family [Dickeya chrysanthemi Ech1591]